MLLNLLRKKEGQSLIIAALVLPVLLGFAALITDVGYMYLTKSQLQNEADAGALAGALALVHAEDPYSEAQNYVTMNGNDKLVDPDGLAYVDGNSVRVTVERKINMFFAPIVGIPREQTIRATATAIYPPAGSASGAVPVGVLADKFLYGVSYQLKVGGGSGTTGNYHLLDFSTNGKWHQKDWQSAFINPPAITLKVGQEIWTITGNKVGWADVQKTVAARIGTDSSTFENVQPGSTRLIIVPIVENWPNGQSTKTKIVGFAQFYLESCDSNEVIYGKFKQMVIDTPDPTPGSGYYGLSANRSILIK